MSNLRNLAIATSIVALLGSTACQKDPLTEKAKHNLELQAKMSPAEREARRKKALSEPRPTAVPTPMPTPRIPKIYGQIGSIVTESDGHGVWVYTITLKDGRCARQFAPDDSYTERGTMNSFRGRFENAKVQNWIVGIDGKTYNDGCIAVSSVWLPYTPK